MNVSISFAADIYRASLSALRSHEIYLPVAGDKILSYSLRVAAYSTVAEDVPLPGDDVS